MVTPVISSVYPPSPLIYIKFFFYFLLLFQAVKMVQKFTFTKIRDQKCLIL